MTEAPASAGAAGALSSSSLLSAFSPPPLQPQPLEAAEPQLSQPQPLLQPQQGSQHDEQPQPLLLNMPQRPSNKQQLFLQPQLEPQLFAQQEGSQQQLCSAQQLFSQQQEGSQQPQPRLLNMPLRPSNKQQRFWQQQLEPQLFAQQEGSQQQLCSAQQLFSPQPQLFAQQDGSAQQLFSQQQEGSQQPQLFDLKQPQSLSSKQQRWLQQLEQLSQQLFCSQQQLFSQQQLCSAQHDFSQQPQLGSTQQPQPLPSILSNKQKPKLGLARAMLTMSAPKKFFIGHSLLYVRTILAED